MLPSTCGDVAWCLVHLRHEQPQGDGRMGPNALHQLIFVRVPPWLHRSVLDRITDTAKASNIERMEAGYESMAHFIINTEDVADMLRGIDFQTGNGFTAMMTPSLSHIHSCLFASASWSAVYLENEACVFVAGEDGEDSGDEAPEDLTTSPGQIGESGRRI